VNKTKENGMLKIDKNVPKPPVSRGNRKYPFSQMEIGDSIFIAGKRSSGVPSLFPRHGAKKFSVRTVTENGVKGVRVWRDA
jgi:hypothetical protein